MADSSLEAGIRPTPIEIIPVEDVAAITTHYNALIRKLQDELADAQAEAALAEERLLVHPAAGVIDDDFESFVLWATQTRLIDIHRDDADRVPEVDAAPRRAPAAVEAVFTEDRPAPPAFHEYAPPTPIARPEVVPPAPEPAPARSVEPPTIATPVTTPPPAAPPVTAPPVPPAAPTVRRSSRRANGTTVVTRPGAPAPQPAAPTAAPSAEPAAPPAQQAQQASPVQAAAPTASNAAAHTDSFWQPSRTRAERSDRPTRAERDAHRRLGGLPSTLMLQAGAVFVIVALLVLKLG